jgi:hypothetical protein
MKELLTDAVVISNSPLLGNMRRRLKDRRINNLPKSVHIDFSNEGSAGPKNSIFVVKVFIQDYAQREVTPPAVPKKMMK